MKFKLFNILLIVSCFGTKLFAPPGPGGARRTSSSAQPTCGVVGQKYKDNKDKEDYTWVAPSNAVWCDVDKGAIFGDQSKSCKCQDSTKVPYAFERGHTSDGCSLQHFECLDPKDVPTNLPEVGRKVADPRYKDYIWNTTSGEFGGTAVLCDLASGSTFTGTGCGCPAGKVLNKKGADFLEKFVNWECIAAPAKAQ